MNFKIINVPDFQTHLCVHRDRSENGNEIVFLTAFVESENDADYIFQEEIEFSSALLAMAFVQDFSKKSALSWLTDEAGAEGIAPINQEIKNTLSDL